MTTAPATRPLSTPEGEPQHQAGATPQTPLTSGQKGMLAAAVIPMIATGAVGALGTYTNIEAEFGRSETALGVVGAGEGLALVLALIVIGLTMLGQAIPTMVRIGMWAVPLAAAIVGLSVADNTTERVIYSITPMAMCISAEGLGLLARRIVIHRTGIDAEALRRNAETIQRIAYHRARAKNHPWALVRKHSDLKAWRLARRVGLGDITLGAQLVGVQRGRLTQGADEALAGMLTGRAGTTSTVREPQPVQVPEFTEVRELPPTEPTSAPGSRTEVPANREPQANREPKPRTGTTNQARTNPEPTSDEPRTRKANPANPKPANLTDRAAAKKNQIEQVLNLIDELGYDATTLGVVRERTGMTKTTAYHRLTEARELWNQRNAA